MHAGDLVRANDATPLVIINQLSPIYVSFAGRVDPMLPQFYVKLGQAAHALEDGFTHTYRTSDGSHVTTSYIKLLTPLLTEGGGQGFCVNLSVDTSSVDIMELCNELGALYIDTVNEPWLGFYFDASKGAAARSNYALRETTLAAKKARRPGSTTAVSCCGANPGMVSFLVKEALLDLAGHDTPAPDTREGWARLAMKLGVRTIHIAERDTQVGSERKQPGEFVNTWSIDGFVSEGCQPAELGWGTHERHFPRQGRRHESGFRGAVGERLPDVSRQPSVARSLRAQPYHGVAPRWRGGRTSPEWPRRAAGQGRR